jgi:FMN-dependent NADH-azoreductase
VALSRGGLHRDAPTDTQLAHIKMFLSFVGLTDVQYVFAEGMGMGPEAVAKAQRRPKQKSTPSWYKQRKQGEGHE